MSRQLTIYTDGAYSFSRDIGGIGIVILFNGKKCFEYFNKYEHTTNNQMELGAIIVALRLLKKPQDSIIFYSDSMYCIGSITKGWKRKKNIKLWNEFDIQLDRVKKLCPNIEFKYTAGHQKDDSEHTKWNNVVDELAVKATKLL